MRNSSELKDLEQKTYEAAHSDGVLDVFTEPRRLWERRIYTTAAVLFGGFMMLARPLGALQPGEVDWRVSPDSLVVWLLAAVLVVLAVLTKLNRLYGYALVLAVAGAAPVIADDSFGWPLLISGGVIAAVGSALLRRFVNQHPRIQTQ